MPEAEERVLLPGIVEAAETNFSSSIFSPD
jgi:hypothetical protein